MVDGMATDLEVRLELLEAERAITRTLHRYAHAIDYGDEEGWVDCFTEDGVFDVRSRHAHQLKRLITGREELRAFIARHTRAPELWHKHLLVEPVIDVDGDTATCASYLAVVMEHEDDPGRSGSSAAIATGWSAATTAGGGSASGSPRSIRCAPTCRPSSTGAPAARECGAGAARLVRLALLAQLVEHLHGKEGVDGSSPSEGLLAGPRQTRRAAGYRPTNSIQSTDVNPSVGGRSPPSQDGNHALR